MRPSHSLFLIANLAALAFGLATTVGEEGQAAAEAVVIHEAANRDPDPGPVGEKPYEMEGRAEERPPLFAFDDVSGWEVEGHEAEGWLYRSQERRLYRDHCGKLVYFGRGEGPWLLVRPKQPIPIPEPWDAVNLWTWGNNWGWVPDPSTPPLEAFAVVQDAGGQSLDIPLGRVDYEYWFMMNGRLHAEELAALKRPFQFVGLRFTNAGNRERRTIYLGPCYLFKEELGPLTFSPWPDELPFPTRADTILPGNKTADFVNETRREGEAVVFSYRGSDCSLEYRYLPTDGTLSDVELRWDGKTIQPCAEGGMRITGPEGGADPGDPAIRRVLKHQGLEGDVFTAVWRLERGEAGTDVEYRMRIAQKSLIVEMEASDPVVESVGLGRARPTEAPKLFKVPFLTYGGRDPHVLYTDGIFLFTQFDWYCSQASALFGEGKLGLGWTSYNGGAQYIPKTDGSRNCVRERLFINASPDFQEVLPTIPNPRSPFQEVQGERLWRVKMGNDYPVELEEARRLRALGCDRVTIRYHEDFWRDAGESFTFRLNAAPGRGGDDALLRFVSDVQSLGWRIGLYTNYCDYAPVNKHWDEDMVIRLPNGDWQRAWPRCYAPKPMYGVEMEARLAPQIQAKFGENHSYCDVHTCVSPFDRVDYDARVPGAATFRRTFECFGRLLYNEKFAHKGPVYSEGTNHWWYAGLTDGNYGQINSSRPSQVPLLVDFDLLKLHPLEMDAGMGAPEMFFRDLPRDLDQFIATTIAYGHIGFLDWHDLPGLLKIYYMVQQLQKRYAMVPVHRIEYEAEGELVDSSRALISGAYLSNRLHVVYENGAEAYVNGSPAPWLIKGPGKDFELPAWGYAAWRAEDDLLVYSAVVPAGGPGEQRGPRGRVDCSLSPEQCYADSRGGFVFLDSIALAGSAALKRDGDKWYAIPTTDCRDLAFSPALVGLSDGGSAQVIGVREDISPAAAPELRWSRGLLHIIPTAESALKYEIRPQDGPRPPLLQCSTRLAVVGSSVAVSLPAAMEAGEVFWEVGGKRFRAETTPEGATLICSVPTAAAEGQHLWLGVRTASDVLWLDFVAAEPCQVSLELPPSVELHKGELLRGAVNVANNLDREATFPIRLSSSGGASCTVGAEEVTLRGGEAGRVEFGLSLPRADGRWDITAETSYAEREVMASRGLTGELIHPVVLSLDDPQAAYVTGYCLRGQEERIGGKTMYDGSFYPMVGTSGGVERVGIFAHPPWGEGRAGYTFASYEMELPNVPSIFFDFWMGIRDGFSRSDGVTYKVAVAGQEGKSAEVFSQHHGELRWRRARVDLSAFAGQRVNLKLITDCGPQDDTGYDHALWGEPRIILYGEDQAVLRVQVAMEAES